MALVSMEFFPSSSTACYNSFLSFSLSLSAPFRGCLLTSSLIGTLSLSLVTPLSILYSMLIGEVSFAKLIPTFKTQYITIMPSYFKVMDMWAFACEIVINYVTVFDQLLPSMVCYWRKLTAVSHEDETAWRGPGGHRRGAGCPQSGHTAISCFCCCPSEVEDDSIVH